MMQKADELKPTQTASWLALITSSGTLICCALPATLVALGAGAALSSLIASVPQLVWFSEHKISVFVTAAVMLLVAGIMQWRSRSLPCPADPALALACTRLRRRSFAVYAISLALFAFGGFFAFVGPLLWK